jgi:hypothetical protein
MALEKSLEEVFSGLTCLMIPIWGNCIYMALGLLDNIREWDIAMIDSIPHWHLMRFEWGFAGHTGGQYG